MYKSNGQNADKFIFPYQSNSFDTVLLMSVFTHMSVEEIKNYLSEIYRVLKPGGKCLSTFFYFDELTLSMMKENKTDIAFGVDMGNYLLIDKHVKSANICIQFNYLVEMINSSGLTISKKIDGYWRQFENQLGNDYQDILVFEK